LSRIWFSTWKTPSIERYFPDKSEAISTDNKGYESPLSFPDQRRLPRCLSSSHPSLSSSFYFARIARRPFGHWSATPWEFRERETERKGRERESSTRRRGFVSLMNLQWDSAGPPHACNACNKHPSLTHWKISFLFRLLHLKPSPKPQTTLSTSKGGQLRSRFN
jgi:hypothetical protein